jgi:hypothetical protein
VQPGRGAAPRVHTLADLLHRLRRLIHLKHLPIRTGAINAFDCGLIKLECCGAMHPELADMHYSPSVIATRLCCHVPEHRTRRRHASGPPQWLSPGRAPPPAACSSCGCPCRSLAPLRLARAALQRWMLWLPTPGQHHSKCHLVTYRASRARICANSRQQQMSSMPVNYDSPNVCRRPPSAWSRCQPPRR